MKSFLERTALEFNRRAFLRRTAAGTFGLLAGLNVGRREVLAAGCTGPNGGGSCRLSGSCLCSGSRCASCSGATCSNLYGYCDSDNCWTSGAHRCCDCKCCANSGSCIYCYCHG